MTSQPKASETGRRLGEAGFDPADDLADAAAFDRALDELLPKGNLAGPQRLDIDPEDFEAFNRELDAQMAQARARTARVDLIEDLGVDVVEMTPLPPVPAEDSRPEVPAPDATGEPELSDDRVTLTSAPPPTEPPSPPAEPPRSPAEPLPAAGAPNAATAAPRAGRSSVVAVVLGLAGLLAGVAALWLSVDRQSELTRLRAALSDPASTPTSSVPALAPTPSEAAEIRALKTRVEELSRQLAALSPPASAPAPTVSAPSPTEPPAVSPAAPALIAKASPADPPASPPPTGDRDGIARSKRPANGSAPAGAAADAAADSARSVPDPASPPPPPATPDVSAAPPPAPVATTTAATPAQGVIKPSGSGPWVVVIDSYAEESVAEQRRAQVARMGVPAEVRWFLVKDVVRYRVIVPGYATQDAASNAAAELRRRSAGGAWVMRLPKQD